VVLLYDASGAAAALTEGHVALFHYELECRNCLEWVCMYGTDIHSALHGGNNAPSHDVQEHVNAVCVKHYHCLSSDDVQFQNICVPLHFLILMLDECDVSFLTHHFQLQDFLWELIQHEKEPVFYCLFEQMLEGAAEAWNSVLICVVECETVASYGHGTICHKDLQHYAPLDLDHEQLISDSVAYLDVWKMWNSGQGYHVYYAGALVEQVV
jgi:hypothetical protein